MLWEWTQMDITPKIRLPSRVILGPDGVITEDGRHIKTALYVVFDSGLGLKLPIKTIRGQQQVHLPAAFGPQGTPGWRLIPAEPELWPWILDIFRAWQAGQEAPVIHIAALAWPLRALWSATALGLTLHPDRPVVVV